MCAAAVAVAASSPLTAAPPTKTAEQTVERTTKQGESTAATETAAPRTFTNQQYSQRDDSTGRCDVMIPGSVEPPAGGFPTVVIVHGGAWMSGDKWTIEGYARFLAEHGYATININYRLAPRYKFPSQVDDVRDALVWAQENAARFSLDLRRIGLFGYSAGGHLSLLVSVLSDEPMETQLASSEWTADDERWQKLPAIQAVCVGGPPCDFRNLPPENTGLAYFLGGSRREKPSVYEAASPTAHVSAQDPPVHLIHGEADSIVPIQNSLLFAEQAKAAGISCDLTTIKGQGHLITFLNPRTSQAMIEFFDKTLSLQ
ncbi:lipase/esterase [Rhodopirellula maiorica SM1]|uniref:Lipase/esterase n=1 Tax=Rhodopirellula maiorica SM1 TaxID=1265738 RepID=M5RIN5_9BACT|nr:alpha/beta hydrolase [Rhodopirellula maiorica]EMI19066.1 lipase/esterase [Rhodopirellula maiorica SM1]